MQTNPICLSFIKLLTTRDEYSIYETESEGQKEIVDFSLVVFESSSDRLTMKTDDEHHYDEQNTTLSSSSLSNIKIVLILRSGLSLAKKKRHSDD